jgi:alpha-L-rhamnosidase
MHRTIGGLAPAAPGYKHLYIQPRPGEGLTGATARHLTPYGMAESAWTIRNGTIELQVVVPPNTTAHVTLPGNATEALEVGAGVHRWAYPYPGPEPLEPPTIDSSVAELRQDPRAWTVVLNTLPNLVPQSDFVRMVLSGQNQNTLRQSLAAVPNGEQALAAIADGLAEL